ncbi:MAG TPA: PAS domain S-box protein, partial [Longimicrobiales bacterium]|nr:PAS domain S-box protein [Longimicrobiales bacterium]
RSTERFRALAEQAPDLVYRVGVRPEPVFEYVSPSSAGLVGYAPEEYYADPAGMLETLVPEDRERLRNVLADPTTAGEIVVLRWRHRDGRTIWTENRLTALRNEDGDVVAVQGIARDITARREAEERNDLLATAVEAAGEAVIITDPDGCIEYVNPAFTEISGYFPEEVLGDNPRLLNSGRQSKPYYEELWATIRSGRTFRGEMVNRRSDGRLYDQECTITPVLDSLGRVRHYVCVARDVTVQRELDERVRQAYKMQAVGQLAAGVAHDFRNLLNVIQVNVDLLLRARTGGTPGARPEGVEPTDEIARLDDVREAARRGGQLVAKLLTLGRRNEIRLVPTDLRSVVSEMRSTLRAILPESISLDLLLSEELPPVNADRGSMEQILLNLVTNARDAIGQEGRVDIEVQELHRAPKGGREVEAELHPGRFVRISVQDSGAGIQPRDLRRIFEPFFTTKPEEQGTGLGLATVRSLVERHAGFVSVQSRPGEGTTVELFFPASTEAVAAASGEEPLAQELLPDLPSGGERILLVEDEAALRDAGARLLSRLGYEVVTAADGAEALDWLAGTEQPPQLIVTDVV